MKQPCWFRGFSIIAVLMLAVSGIQASGINAPSHFAKLDGHKIHYKSLGKGQETLVFIHGWSCNLDFWQENASAFADQAQVLVIDLLGHGNSDKPQIKYSMELFARAIDA